jgi:Flp pilus assembly protein TadD
MGRWLCFAFCLTLLAAPALPAADEMRQEPHGQQTQIRPDPAGAETERHDQRLIQRRSAATIRSTPGPARVDLLAPEKYATPEDAEILQGWEALPSLGPSGRAAAQAYELSDMARGWQLYAAGRYAAAAESFAAAIEAADPQEAASARLGLAYSLIRLGRREKAIAHLAALTRGGYRLSETRPALAGLLIQAGRWAPAADVISKLPPEKRRVWERRLLEARLVEDYRALPRPSGPDALLGWLNNHSEALSACIRPDLFHAVGRELAAAGERGPAAALYRRLLECGLTPELRLGIVVELADWLPEEEALTVLRREKEAPRPAPAAREAELEAVEVRLLQRRLAALPVESDAAAGTARSILKLAPDDPEALRALAWHHFNNGRFETAESIFARLWERDPSSKELALALGYARLNSGRADSALDPLDRGAIAADAETRRLRELVYRQQASNAYAAGDWDQTAVFLEQLLLLDPADRDAMELLAWTRQHQDRRAEARTLLEAVFDERPRPDMAASLLGLYRADGDEARAAAFAGELSRDPDPGLRASAADFFFDRGAPITAAQLDPGPDRCYTHADSPRFEAFLYHRSKDGDDGFSRLEETALPLTLTFATELGREWSGSLTPRYLSSGGAPARPRAGRYFRSLNGAPVRHSLEDDLLVVQPELGLELEGRYHASVRLGATPLGGPVAPTATFDLRVSAPEGYIDLHRCDVRDSILSFVGQEDPYGRDEWGRVTRNGIAAGKTWPLSSEWWLSGSLGFNAYRGENTWDNESYHLDAAVGRTHRIDQDELSYGLFFTAQHYRRNSDFFTYGHGGYYSPELMTMAGPFIRYRTALCRDYWFDVQASAGWLHQRLDSSPVYPLFDGDTTGFTPEAAADARSDYDSDTDNKIGISLRLQGMKLITPHIAAGGFAGFDNSADHTEWTLGAGIQIFFDPQNLFWTRKDMLTQFGPCR